MEQLLFYLVRIAAAINHAIRAANAAIQNNPNATFTIPIDTSSPIPKVDVSQAQAVEPTTGTAIETITKYLPPLYIPWESESILNFFATSLDAAGKEGIPPSEIIDEGDGYREQGVETLPVCQEQDPSILSFTDGDLITLINKPI
jgi:hypothetical protein